MEHVHFHRLPCSRQRRSFMVVSPMPLQHSRAFSAHTYYLAYINAHLGCACPFLPQDAIMNAIAAAFGWQSRVPHVRSPAAVHHMFITEPPLAHIPAPHARPAAVRHPAQRRIVDRFTCTVSRPFIYVHVALYRLPAVAYRAMTPHVFSTCARACEHSAHRSAPALPPHGSCTMPYERHSRT